MKKERVETILLCRRDETAERVLMCLQGNREVRSANFFQEGNIASLFDKDIPEDTVRLILLDDILFDRNRAGKYLAVCRNISQTVTGIFLHNRDLTPVLRSSWNSLAYRSHCAGVLTMDRLSECVSKTIKTAVRLSNSEWPEKSVSRVPEAAFWITGSTEEDGRFCGRIWNRYIDGGKSFYGVEGLLFSLDELCNELDFPQRYTVSRALQVDMRKKRWAGLWNKMEYRLYVPDDLKLPAAPFCLHVKVQSRAFCSMQGEIFGVGGEKVNRFESADELARLVSAETAPHR